MNVNIDYKNSLAVAALLHDIGKLMRRGGITNKTHHYASYEFILTQLKDKDIFSDEEVDFIANLARHHHDDKYDSTIPLEDGRNNIFLRIIKESDADSASERKEYTGEQEGSEERKPLTNIISAVNSALTEEGEIERIKVYYPQEYFPFAFPQDLNEYLATEKGAGELYKAFLSGFQELINASLSKEHFIVSLNFLLKQYTSYITSSGKEAIRDISLYHHLSTTAAFAICRYLDLEKYGFKREHGYKIIYGRLFDVQEYISHNLNKNIEKPLRRLITRSKFIALTGSIMPYQIVRELGLYPFNIILSSGESFLIVIPRSLEEKANRLLKNIQKKVSEMLENKAYFEYVTEDLFVREEGYSFEEYFREAFRKLQAKRFQRSLDYLILDLGKKYCRCENCDINTLQGDLCKACELENKWLKVDVKKICIPYSKLSIEFLEDPDYIVGDDSGEPCLYFDYDFAKQKLGIAGIREIGATEILKSEAFCKDCSEKENCEISLDSPISLNCFSGKSMNDDIIATAKINVDDMSFILYEVYPIEIKKGDKIERYPFSVSRLSYISSSVDGFFTSYIKRFIEEYCQDRVLLLYSGGNEMLVTGIWEDVINTVLALEEKFAEYVTSFPKREITLSGAVHLHNPKRPFNRIIEKVESQLQAAKEYKNRISVNGTLLKYGELREAVDASEKMAEWIKAGYVPRGFLFSMLRLLDMTNRGDAIATARRAAMFNYLFQRNVASKQHFEDRTHDAELKENVRKLFSAVMNVPKEECMKSRLTLELAIRKTKSKEK